MEDRTEAPKMKIIVFGKPHYVDSLIQSFAFTETHQSSNVKLFGLDEPNKKILVLFRSGSAYIYRDVDKEIFKDILECESIGKFISSKLVKVFPSAKIDAELFVKVDPDN